ncbi:site-specific integrase [Dehalogenimonas sp. 4OHTPN]|uniref:Site-specific integrase n=1 Tax=Dehalogenimonas sp. 4OHTPN TaxID=3166643 RepID=A0AAU8GBH5_9CHLR
MTTKSYLEPQDIGCLISAANNLRDRLLATMLFHLSCRISEALGITVDDIDLNNRTVTIKHLKSRIKLKCPTRWVYFGGCCFFRASRFLEDILAKTEFYILHNNVSPRLLEASGILTLNIFLGNLP